MRFDFERVGGGTEANTSTGRDAMHEENDRRGNRTSKPIRGGEPAGPRLPLLPAATGAVQRTGGEDLQSIDRGSYMIPATIGEILKEVPAVKMAAIPTMFESIEFRSRLEAKWSAIFTEFGWHCDPRMPHDGATTDCRPHQPVACAPRLLTPAGRGCRHAWCQASSRSLATHSVEWF